MPDVRPKIHKISTQIRTSSNRRLESAFYVTGQPGQTGQISPDQSRSQALSPPPLQKNLRGMPDVRPMPRSIKSRLKSVLGSVLPTSNAIRKRSSNVERNNKNIKKG